MKKLEIYKEKQHMIKDGNLNITTK